MSAHSSKKAPVYAELVADGEAVGTTGNPLIVTTTGAGPGGAEEVVITSANGDAETHTGALDGTPASEVGLQTNSRNYGYNGTTWDRLSSTDSALHVLPADGSKLAITGTGGDAATGTYAGSANSVVGLDVNARLLAQDGNAATNAVMLQAFPAGSDELLAADILLQTAARQVIFNGTTWDRVRGNLDGVLLASAARTATTSSPNQTNHNSRGVVLFLDVTANPGGAETLSVDIEYINPVTGTAALSTVKLDVPAATNGIFTLQVYPGTMDTPENPTNNTTYSMMLPRTWRATVTPSASGSWTYSLGYSLIV